jgi:hypothetical protein
MTEKCPKCGKMKIEISKQYSEPFLYCWGCEYVWTPHQQAEIETLKTELATLHESMRMANEIQPRLLKKLSIALDYLGKIETEYEKYKRLFPSTGVLVTTWAEAAAIAKEGWEKVEEVK